MLQDISEHPPNKNLKVSFLYSTKPPVPEPYMRVLSRLSSEDLQLFITADTDIQYPHQRRRMTGADLKSSIGKFPEDRTLVYICGPPVFTDQFISMAVAQTRLPRERVLAEKWW